VSKRDLYFFLRLHYSPAEKKEISALRMADFSRSGPPRQAADAGLSAWTGYRTGNIRNGLRKMHYICARDWLACQGRI
jgi:hypothetical protein